MKRWLIVALSVLFFSSAYATIESYKFDSVEQEQRFFDLTNELRCPKCQNQSIADSNAPIAKDLRREVHRLVSDGADNQTVIDFMLDRYGEFVLYKPKLEAKTLILWLGPFLLLLLGVFILVSMVRKHRPTAVTGLSDGSDDLSDEQRAKLNKALDGERE